VSDTEPVLLIPGGIDGAGKSTQAAALAATPPIARLFFLDPDKVAKELIVARPGIDPNLAAAEMKCRPMAVGYLGASAAAELGHGSVISSSSVTGHVSGNSRGGWPSICSGKRSRARR